MYILLSLTFPFHNRIMDVLGHRERDFGVDDDEVVADRKEEEPGVLELEGDIITTLDNHQGVSA